MVSASEVSLAASSKTKSRIEATESEKDRDPIFAIPRETKTEGDPDLIPGISRIPISDDRTTLRDPNSSYTSDNEEDDNEDETPDLSLEPFALSEVLNSVPDSVLHEGTENTPSEDLFASQSPADQELIQALLAFGIDDPNDQIDEEETPTDEGRVLNNLNPLELLALRDQAQEKDNQPSTLDRSSTNEIAVDESEEDLKVLRDELTSSPLPELELDFGDDNFLLESDFLELQHIFDDSYRDTHDDDDGDESIEGNDDIGSTPIHLVEDPEETALFANDTDDLYKELATLSLGNTASETTAAESTSSSQDTSTTTTLTPAPGNTEQSTRETMVNNLMEGTDGLPAYMLCQPCQPSGIEATDVANLAQQSQEQLDAAYGTNQPMDESNDFVCKPCTPSTPDSGEALSSLSMLELMSASRDFQLLMKEDPQAASELLGIDEDDDLWKEVKALPPIHEATRAAASPFITAFGLVPNPEMEDAQDDNETKKQKTPPSAKSSERAFYGHRETIFGVAFSEDGRFCATASQDSSVGIWEVATNKLLTRLEQHSKSYECLRVAWASPQWASNLRGDHEDWKGYVVASSGADGQVFVSTCPDPLAADAKWTRQYSLDHSNLNPQKKEEAEAKATGEFATTGSVDEQRDERPSNPEDDKPQVYSLQFIDHWQAFNTGVNGGTGPNSFLITSSDDLIHVWELERRKPEQIVELVGTDKIRMAPDTFALREVMSLHFSDMHQYGYGVSLCSVTRNGLDLPPPPADNAVPEAAISFGGDRNPDNKIYVFDAGYCLANGLLGAALSDGSLRLINGRGICVCVVQLPGCQSHLTSFAWDATGSRLATSVATGHVICWDLDFRQAQHSGVTTATCTAIMEGGHTPGRPLYGLRYCGRDDNLLISWGVDGQLCMWDSRAEGNVHSPLAILRKDEKYPIYAVAAVKNVIALGGGSEGGFIGVPLYVYALEEDAVATTPSKRFRPQVSSSRKALDNRPKIETIPE